MKAAVVRRRDDAPLRGHHKEEAQTERATKLRLTFLFVSFA